MSDREALIDAFSEVSFSDWPDVQRFVEGRVADAILSSGWLAAHDAAKRAEWEAEQGWEYAIGAQSEDRPGKFWRDSDWDTTTELHEALGDLEDALPVFSNAVVIRRRPSTPWLPVPDTKETGKSRDYRTDIR